MVVQFPKRVNNSLNCAKLRFLISVLVGSSQLMLTSLSLGFSMGYRKTAETMTRERKSIAAAVFKAILMEIEPYDKRSRTVE